MAMVPSPMRPPPKTHTTTSAAAAPVFQVVAFALVIEAHENSLAIEIDGVAGFARYQAGGCGKVFILAGIENGT
jgi:hypothetical protein